MRGEVHILVYCPIDTFQWGSTHSAMFPQSNENREKRIVSKESTRITETQNG